MSRSSLIILRFHIHNGKILYYTCIYPCTCVHKFIISSTLSPAKLRSHPTNRMCMLHTKDLHVMHTWVVSLDEEMLCLPGVTCCQVSNGQLSGAYTSPGYPSYQHNLDCTYVIRVPNGYSIQMVIHNFDIEKRYTIMIQ